MLKERARVLQFFSLTGRSQRLDADIYTDFSFGPLQGLDVSLNQDADEIAPAGVPADGQVDKLRVVGKRAAPHDVERSGLLGQCDPPLSVRAGVRGVASRLAMTTGFEFGILRPLLEEISEGCIEIAERLLKHDGTDLGKKGPVRVLLPFSESGGGRVIVNGFLLLPPCVSAIFERPIVHKAGAAEGPGKLRDLLISGKESVFKGLLDYHWDISHYICGLYIHS